jgi:hypothetical protein
VLSTTVCLKVLDKWDTNVGTGLGQDAMADGEHSNKHLGSAKSVGFLDRLE